MSCERLRKEVTELRRVKPDDEPGKAPITPLQEPPWQTSFNELFRVDPERGEPSFGECLDHRSSGRSDS
jgi:hypothetical protein